MKLWRIVREKKYLLRIFLWINCMILLILLPFSSLIYVNVEKNMFQSEYEGSQKLLSQMKYNIDYLDTMISKLTFSTYGNNDVKALMYLNDEETYDHMNTINKLNATVVANYPFVQSVYVYNNHKKMYYSTFGELYHKDAELDKVLAQNAPIIPLKAIVRKMQTGGTTAGPTYDTVLSYVMFENVDAKGVMDGAIILNVKLDWLVDNIRTINQFDARTQSDLYILDNKNQFIETDTNQMIAENPSAVTIKRAFETSVSQERMHAGESAGFYETEVNGDKLIVSYIYLEKTGWTLLEAKPYKEVYANLKQLMDTIVIITGAVFVGALLLTLSVSRGIYKPVRRLIEQTSPGGAGKEGFLKPGVKDEFSYLTEVYQKSREQLYEYNLEKNNNTSIMKIYFLKKLMADSYSMNAAEFEDVLRQLNDALTKDKPFIICVLRIDEYKKFLSHKSLAERELLRFAIANVTTDALSQISVAQTVDMKDDSLTILLNTADSQENAVEQVEQAIREAQNYMEKHYHITFTATVSTIISEYTAIAAAYNETLANSSYRYVFGTKSVITQAHIDANIENVDIEHVLGMVSKFTDAVPKGHAAKTEERLRELFSQIRQLDYGSIMLVSMQVVHHLKMTIFEMNRTSKEPIAVPARLMSRELYEEETIEQFEGLLLEAVRAIHSEGEEKGIQGNQVVADTIKEIIDSNYFDSSLSAASISDMMRLPAYKLSKIAKIHLGMSIPEYINQVKLHKAVEWMENSKLSIQEIMQRVGVENESYFYKLFKAKFGMTPREYMAKRMR
ncbi:helix-turn-helix domain-containing protein [Paenibacillus qinlingensis]|uniref:AraC-like DNA-binding protein/vacuolar-type H+-ATPase subunit F/Vma7 n=1 Tax=Paenibacillus qinlingensis TaxID=1837343 RepID=A0ABU1NVY1_9BACL|nr:helix-turn-helix domain-containing protein [Paenibacillus qinlingensis]MDR6551618.1 AraC-like DNA-binding protein/vacuolar-type H+-ATPase subunit F/Vma7 [Paenibacillus qinlingensis]